MLWVALPFCFVAHVLAANVEHYRDSSAQIGADASQKWVRREQQQSSGLSGSSLAEGSKSANAHAAPAPAPPLTPNVDNGSFEDVTLVTDNLGVQFYTHALASPRTEVPVKWKGSGNVAMVPSGSTDWGGLPAPHGGVYVALQDVSSQINQAVSDHKVGQKYMLSFDAATKPEGPKGTMEIRLHGARGENAGTGTDPDWSEELFHQFVAFDFVYVPTQPEVTITIKNSSPSDSVNTVFVDGFDISPCSSDGECNR